MGTFTQKTDYLLETKSKIKDRLNSLGASITAQTTFRNYLTWLDNLYTALSNKNITGLPDSLEGKCEQNGTPTPSSPIPINITTGRQVVSVCGKNLINQVETHKTASSTGVISTGNNSYLGIEDYVNCLPNTTYAITFEHNHPNASLNVAYKDKNGNFISRTGYGTNRTFTTPNNAYYLFFYLYRADAFPTIDGYVQMEYGSSSSSYEEYKGNDYEINLGKNLANIENIQIGKSWSNVANTNRATILFIPVIAGQQYSLVSSYTNENITQIRGVLNKGANDQVSSLVVNGTFTVASGWSYISIEVITNTTFTSSMLDGVKIMLCKGTATISDYSPYKTPIYLGEIGNYKDYIFKNTTENPLYDSTLEEGQWYIHKEVGKVVLTGSENWQSYNYGTNSWRLNGVISTNFNTNELQIMSNKFKGIAHINRNNDYAQIYTENNSMFTIRNTTYTTKAEAQSGMSGQPVYYVLNTPTNTLIEDEELINQLNEIEIFTVISEDFYN